MTSTGTSADSVGAGPQAQTPLSAAAALFAAELTRYREVVAERVIAFCTSHVPTYDIEEAWVIATGITISPGAGLGDGTVVYNMHVDLLTHAVPYDFNLSARAADLSRELALTGDDDTVSGDLRGVVCHVQCRSVELHDREARTPSGFRNRVWINPAYDTGIFDLASTTAPPPGSFPHS